MLCGCTDIGRNPRSSQFPTSSPSGLRPSGNSGRQRVRGRVRVCVSISVRLLFRHECELWVGHICGLLEFGLSDPLSLTVRVTLTSEHSDGREWIRRVNDREQATRLQRGPSGAEQCCL